MGLASGFFYYGLHHLTFALNRLRFNLVKERMDQPLVVFGVLTGFSMALALVGFVFSWWEPAAAGSGMPELIAYLNGLERPRYISWRTLVAKVVGMTCIVSAGLFSGYDGPLIHVCMIFAVIVIRNVKKVPMIAHALYGLGKFSENGSKTSLVRTLRSHELRMFATVGAATGIASAFQAPLAGVCFAIEEAISHFDPGLILRALFASAMSLVAISLANSGTKANGTSYSIYAVNTPCSNLTLHGLDYLLFAVIGLFGGVFGAAYNWLVAKTRMIRARTIQRTLMGKLAEVVGLVIVTSGLVTITFYGPPWSSWTAAECTPFGRSISHFTKVPSVSECSLSCTDWRDASLSASALRNCTTIFQTSLCATDDMWLGFAVVRSSLFIVATGTLTKTFNQIIAETANVTATTCDPTSNDLLSVQPTSESLETGIDLVKSSIPDMLYTDVTLASHSPSNANAGGGGHSLLEKRAGTSVTPEMKIASQCYYQMPSLVMNPAEAIIDNLFQRGMYYLFEAWPLVVFGTMYVILSIATHNITMPTDMVMPCLVIGAIMGRLFGIAYNQLQHSAGTGFARMDPGAASLLGMCAFWAGTSRMMITIIVVALQATGDMTYLNGVTLVVIIAAFIGNQIGPSQFHLEIEAMELPFLPHHPPPQLKAMSVKELIKKVAPEREGTIHVMPLTDDECTVRHAIALLTHRWSPDGSQGEATVGFVYNGFPVVDRQGRVEGHILRSQLERVIADLDPNAPIGPDGQTGQTFHQHRMALSALDDKWRRSEVATAPLPRQPMDDRVLNLSIKDMVVAQMNQSPHTVQEHMCAHKAFQQFRALELRHMLVVSKTNKILFVLTRRDFAHVIEEAHERGHQYSSSRNDTARAADLPSRATSPDAGDPILPLQHPVPPTPPFGKKRGMDRSPSDFSTSSSGRAVSRRTQQLSTRKARRDAARRENSFNQGISFPSSSAAVPPSPTVPSSAAVPPPSDSSVVVASAPSALQGESAATRETARLLRGE
ncbi:chloride channel [Blastocladiella britannica]|nr:chloride channel [Blastocladiella britannica]